jgi:NAD-dependent dihydropyrimidine dehydrogenase PreA subunit
MPNNDPISQSFKPLTVVISQGQSRSPEKRELEKKIADSAANLAGVCVLKVPHLYDLPKDSETYKTLRTIAGDIVVMSWLFDRATHWTLDRHGVRGQVGEVLLKQQFDDEDDEEVSEPEELERVTDSQPREDRFIYCIDFRASMQASDYIAEIERIARERQQASLRGEVSSESLARFNSPTNDTFVGAHTPADSPATLLFGTSSIATIDEQPGRRWYPVIDFSRCTNCMECIDFCLFGVYGVDTIETIVVEQPDNCRKGCPACSRVCPQNAIIFPQHKTPAIAGAPVDTGGMKIDLSKLFGAPDEGEDAVAVAARERDEQLILAGREAVGLSTGISERLGRQSDASKKHDELDDLIDQLDSLDL